MTARPTSPISALKNCRGVVQSEELVAEDNEGSKKRRFGGKETKTEGTTVSDLLRARLSLLL